VFDEGVAFFSSAEVSISRNSFWSMFMLMLCFMSAAALSDKGIEYITLYPANLFSFVITTVGLLLLALYAVYFSKKSFEAESLAALNLHTVGVIVTLVGLYFGGLYVMWIFLGSVGGWGIWYAWILGHNLDLWAMSLPFVGLPLLFKRKAPES
jgi:hypothetical protein